jgi:hypothetical protein
MNAARKHKKTNRIAGPAANCERRHKRRIREAIRRAEIEANRFLDWLRARGGVIDGAVVADCFDQCKRDELQKLEDRDRRAQSRARRKAA